MDKRIKERIRFDKEYIQICVADKKHMLDNLKERLTLVLGDKGMSDSSRFHEIISISQSIGEIAHEGSGLVDRLSQLDMIQEFLAKLEAK